MDASIGFSGAGNFAFELFGVRVGVTTDTPEVNERIPAALPPGARPCSSESVEESFGVVAEHDGLYRLERLDSPVVDGLDLELALRLLESQLRIYVGLHARDRIVVHAGVVAHQGRAIVMPGRSLVGKTTLVLELVRAGAVYYSDEAAVLDDRGLVHPYPTTPAVREPGRATDVELERLNGGSGGEPLPLGAVVLTTYRPGALWRPTRLARGRGALAMYEHAATALTRPEEAIRVIMTATDGAVVLEGERGEAQEVVAQLLSDAVMG